MPQKQYKASLFIFRRDLRLQDNNGLLQALMASESVMPIFIFDTRQVGITNTYRSLNALQFMIESLEDLVQQIKKKGGKIYFFKGIAEKVIETMVRTHAINAIFINKDYTPFSLKRDAALQKICFKYGLGFHAYADTLLNEPDDIRTKSGTPYVMFTPFFRACRIRTVAQPQKNKFSHFYTGKITESDNSLLKKMMPKKNPQLWAHGGTTQAQKILKQLRMFQEYKKTRDIPSEATSNLSAHNKFGTVSIREVYHSMADSLGPNHTLITQLYWRDFFYHVAYHSPFVFGHAFHKKYDAIAWSKNKEAFEHWCTGTTGFPIVDAGMRQLNATGYMHNRVRMIVASFLTKDLHINWLWGERYFAQKLIDYDPCINNGNWQWAASTGCDSQPYFRIFNPWLQQKKFDPEALYIQTWIPALAQTPAKIIHRWKSPKSPIIKNYPRPLIDHKQASKMSKKLFSKQ